MASRLGSLVRHVVAEGGTAPRPDDDAASAVVGPVLSPEDHEMFVREGLCVLRGAIPQDVCAAAVELLEAPGDGEEAVREDGTWRQPTAEDGGADKLLAATLTAPILAAIAELFGDSNAFEFDPCNPANLPAIARRSGDFTRYDDFARPQQQYDGDTPPEQEHIAHIDDNHPSVMPSGWAVGSFIFLTDVPVVGAGAFVTFPGSPARYRVATAESQRCLVEAAPLVGGAAREMLVNAGDVAIVHHLMGHCGSTNHVHSTRHAFFPRWRPVGRLVPGLKPFSEMSTAEKANSARYIQAHLRPELRVSPLAEPGAASAARDAALREGMLEESLAHGLLHYGGAAQLAWVSGAEPTVVRFSRSVDGCAWEEQDSTIDLSSSSTWLYSNQAEDRPALYIRDTPPSLYERSAEAGAVPLRPADCEEVALPAAERITHLALHEYGVEALLTVTFAAHGGCRTALFASRDAMDWRLVNGHLVGGAGIGLPFDFYASTLSPLVKQHSHACFTVPAGEPDAVFCRWGRDWHNSATCTEATAANRFGFVRSRFGLRLALLMRRGAAHAGTARPCKQHSRGSCG